MSHSSEYRARKAAREEFARLICRWVVAGLAGAVVLFVAVLLACLALQVGGAL